MRTAMHDMNEAKQRMNEDVATRRLEGDKLVESLVLRPGIGEGLKEAYGRDADRVRNLAFAIKHTENHFSRLSESQISSAFGTTPENVMRVLRLGYLNTCRQDAFWEVGMQTARDVFYHLEPVYGKTLRGATKGKVMFESDSYRSASEEEQIVVTETPNGTLKTFSTAALSGGLPVRPFTCGILVNNARCGNDDGRGNLVGSDIAGAAITGTINYDTGAASITFAGAAPATGADIRIVEGLSLEADSDLTITQSAELQLRATPFTLTEYPIYGSFSKMTELLLGTTLEIEAEDAYLRSMADELRKSLDFQAFRMGYNQALRNAKGSPVAFNMQGAVGESESDRVQAISRYIGKAGNKMYSDLLRGGVSKIYGGPSAVDVLTMHDKWSDAGAQNQNGIYKLGMLGNIDVFKTPSTIVPDDELVCLYKNPDAPEDVFLIIGTLVPMHVTDKLETPDRNTSFGVASYGDVKIVNPAYAQIIKIGNI